MMAQSNIDTALRGYVDRIVILHEERDEKNADIREVYAELKGAGFNVTIVRQMVKEQRMDVDARNSLYQLEEEYRIKLGMLAGTPLGDAAEAREFHGDQGDNIHPWPEKPFAEQPVHQPKRRGRPRKIDEHLDNARRHLGFDDEPRGNA